MGNINKIVDENRDIVVKYTYDAWGNFNKIIYRNCIAAHHNPFVYKGYLFDSETGWYYLKSRYYDPTIRRFINADDFSYLDSESLTGINLYSYCGNNPVMYKDSNGCFALTILGISIGIYELIKAIAIVVIAVVAIATVVRVEEQTHAISNTLENINDTLEDIKKGAEALLLEYVVSLVLKGQYPNEKETHHIVARRDPRAWPSKLILKSCNIGIEDSKNKVPVKKSYHKVLHTNVYYVILNGNMIIAYAVAGKEGVEATLKAYQVVLGGL